MKNDIFKSALIIGDLINVVVKSVGMCIKILKHVKF